MIYEEWLWRNKYLCSRIDPTVCTIVDLMKRVYRKKKKPTSGLSTYNKGNCFFLKCDVFIIYKVIAIIIIIIIILIMINIL